MEYNDYSNSTENSAKKIDNVCMCVIVRVFDCMDAWQYVITFVCIVGGDRLRVS